MAGIGNLLLCAGGGALVLALIHFACILWHIPLKRPQAYTIGVSVLLVAFWVWAWLENEVRAAVVMTAIAVAGGGMIQLLWLVNGRYMPLDVWPGGRLTQNQLRLRMIELLENIQAERSLARDLRGEAEEIDERIDFYLRMIRDPELWKPDMSFREVRRRVGQEE